MKLRVSLLVSCRCYLHRRGLVMALLRKCCLPCIFILIASAGCGGIDLFEFDSNPVMITGKVFYRGYPVNGGWIVFSSDPAFRAGTELVMCEILSDGSFHVHDDYSTGLKPGHYRIAISSNPNPYWHLPRRYQNPDTSGLCCTVTANQPLRLRIELE